MKRFDEELVLLSEEKKNVVGYWLYQKEAIKHYLATIHDSTTLYTSGCRALLLKYQWKVDFLHSNVV